MPREASSIVVIIILVVVILIIVIVIIIVRRHPWFSNQGVPGVGTDSFAIS